MKHFDIPPQYKAHLISAVKEYRKKGDKLKKDLSATRLDFECFEAYLPRNFGFCYGVENAISLTYNVLHQYPQKNIYLLSELIHNPQVNEELTSRGIQFLMDTNGKKIKDFSTLTPDDIVIIPAFGTTLEIEQELKNLNVTIETFYATCPFVEKVWHKADELKTDNYTIIIHGKPYHEETKATFSHAQANNTPCLIIQNIKEAELVAQYIQKQKPYHYFFEDFSAERYSIGFDPQKHLSKIGVINQTTMLADETREISMYLKNVLKNTYACDDETIKNYFADTRDTLCYATNDNQKAVEYMIEHTPLDMVIVIGGSKSSNTGNLFKLCSKKYPSFFITQIEDIVDNNTIKHFDIKTYTTQILNDININQQKRIGVVIGASCPDIMIENLLVKLLSFFNIDSIQAQQKLQTLTKQFAI